MFSVVWRCRIDRQVSYCMIIRVSYDESYYDNNLRYAFISFAYAESSAGYNTIWSYPTMNRIFTTIVYDMIMIIITGGHS